MTVAPPRSSIGSRVSTTTVVAASIALIVGVAALLVGITTWPGLLLAAAAVTVDLVVLLQHPSRRFAAVGIALGIVLLVGILVIATMLVIVR